MIKLKKILTILLTIFFSICIFMPGDVYKLKFAVLPFIVMLGLLDFKAILKNRKYHIFILMGTIYPLCLFLWSFLLSTNFYESLAGAYCPILFLFIIVIDKFRIDYRLIVTRLLEIMLAFMICFASLDLLGFIDINTSIITTFIYSYDIGMVGKSTDYFSYYKIFFKTSPLFLLLIPDYFKNRSTLRIILVYIAMIISGTRANIIVSSLIIIYGYYKIYIENIDSLKLRMLLKGASVFFVFVLSPFFYMIISDMFSAPGAIKSDAVRFGQLISFLDFFSEPSNLLFGTGFGVPFYDMGRLSYAMNSEMSYFDLIRKIGLIFSLPFFIFIFAPILFLNKLHRFVYVGYLVEALSNPLLYSTTGFIIYIFYYSLILENWREKI